MTQEARTLTDADGGVRHVHPGLLRSQLGKHEHQIDPVFQQLEEDGIWNTTWDPSYWAPGADRDTTVSFLQKISTTIKQVCGHLPNVLYRGNPKAKDPDFFFAHEDAQAKAQAQTLAKPGSAEKSVEAVPTCPYHRAVGHLRRKASADVLDRAWQRQTFFLKQLFMVNAIRFFANGMTLAGPNLRFWHMDCGGLLISCAYDLSTVNGAKALIWMLIGLLSIDTAMDLGLDPTIEIRHFGLAARNPPELSAILMVMNVKDMDKAQLIIKCQRPGKADLSFSIKSVQLRSHEIFGRATVAFVCKEVGNESNVMTVKRSFEDSERLHYGALLLKKACDAGVKNIAKYLDHENVSLNDTGIDLNAYIRNGLEMTTETGDLIGEIYPQTVPEEE